jgi:CheY-like chemotaxis protein
VASPDSVPRLSSLNDVTLLIVEDDADIRDAMTLVLESVGVHVSTAANGLEALDRLVTLKPDAILCDLRMPRMDGVTLVQRVRQSPSRLHVPVLGVSAQLTAGDQDRMRRLGFTGLLTKPFSEVELWSAVARLAGGRPGMRAQRDRVRAQAKMQCARADAVRRRARALIEDIRGHPTEPADSPPAAAA